jgi:hypothetical protein
MKNDSALKKHHFWLLLGLVPLLTLLAVVMVNSSVGGAIAKKQEEIDKAEKDIASKGNPKSEGDIKKVEKLLTVVEKKQGELWKENWERQKGIYTWPDQPLLKDVERLNLKFGQPIPRDRGELEIFKQTEVYQYQFSSLKPGVPGTGVGMADRVAPTQFRGGDWRNVLRHVNAWGDRELTSDQVWLLMEDIWVQRSMLEAVRAVNQDLSTFQRVKYEKDGAVIDDPDPKGSGPKNPTRRLFRSRTWEVALEVVREGDSQRLTGTLTNITDRLQLLGVGNMMTLHVWLDTNPNSQPIVFKIGEEFLPGKGATKVVKDDKGNEQTVPANVLKIVPTEDHLITGAPESMEIARVEQVFDVRTVPIKRIDALVLGALDSRLAETTLVGPLSPPFAPIPETPAPTTGTGAEPGGIGSGAGPPPGLGPMGMGGVGGTTATNRQPWGGGPITAVVDANKKRYINASEQVRRMPVGMVVVVDQAYMQDVLLALTNSPLRFQITQTTWTRFRGSLSGLGGVAAGNTEYGSGLSYSEGTIGFGGGSDPDERGPRKPGITAPGLGSGMGPPPGLGSTSGPPAGLGSGGYGGYNPYGGYAPSSVSESQLTSGLIELSVYGIVTLYEKYEAPKPADAPADPKPADPKPADPMPGEPNKAPTPNQPMTNQPTPPKMRRRR